MKHLLLTFLFCGAGLMLTAETNVTELSTAKATPRGQTEIVSQRWELDYLNGVTIYSGHVRVDDPQLRLTCERLTARFLPNTRQMQLQSIIAETNVVADAVDWQGSTNHCTADKMVYTYSLVTNQATDIATEITVTTNQTLELTGSPYLTNYARGSGISASFISVDLVKGTVSVRDQTSSFNSEALRSAAKELEHQKIFPGSNPPEPPK